MLDPQHGEENIIDELELVVERNTGKGVLDDKAHLLVDYGDF